MITGIVTKYQTYTTGKDCSLSVLVDEKFAKEARDLDKEEIVILTAEEYKQLTNGGFNVNRQLGIQIAKELLEEAHSKVLEMEDKDYGTTPVDVL